MSEVNAAPPPASDAVTIGKAELAELRAIKAAAETATGQSTGLLGALAALKINADRAAKLDEKIQVKAVVDRMVAAGQIAPKDRVDYEAYTLADAESAEKVIRKPAAPPARASADPGPAEGGLPPVAGKSKPVPDAVRARARTLIAGKED